MEKIKALLRNIIKEELDDVDQKIYQNRTGKDINSPYNKNKVKPALEKLKSILSPEGWNIITKFIRGHNPGGFNRPNILVKIANGEVSKTDLRSYSNTDLLGLIDTKDLIINPKTKKYSLPTNSPEFDETGLAENDINELARISEKVKIGDKAKAEKIKKLYANAGAFKWIANIIEVIEKAGDAGIARMDAIDTLHKEYKQNKTQQEINPKLKDLIDSGVLLSAGLSQPKAEKNVGGDRGRPTSEKTQIARQVDAKLQADKEYQATEDELSALGAEFIEKLRKRVKGELKRGRPSKPKDVMENEESKRKLEDKGFKSNPPRYIYLGTNPGGGFSYYFYPETKGMETFKGNIENGNHMSYPDVKKFFETTEPIDSAKKLLQNIGVN